MNKGIAGKVKISTYNDIVGGEDVSVIEVPLEELHQFNDHPFRVLDDEKMQDIVDSIKKHGVLMPGIVRPGKNGGYEIIAGHRRRRACELAGLETMPVLVKDYTDDEAVIAMVDSNLQREEILPSEKAFAYRMKFEALSHQGKRDDDASSTQVGWKAETASMIGEAQGDSKNQVRRYIRLTELQKELLDLVDGKKLKFNPAVEISYLPKGEQKLLMKVMEEDAVMPSLTQAGQLKKLSQDKAFTKESVHAILTVSVIREKQFTIKREVVERYFEPETTDEEMENVICTLLEEWKRKKR